MSLWARERSGAPSSGSIPLGGMLLLVLVCCLWGGNMVSIKISNQGLPPCLAAAVRSGVATLLLWVYARMKREKAFIPRQYCWQGVFIGLLFGLDFLFLYWGTAFTHASRAVIFLYTHPFWVALGAHFIIAADSLNLAKGGGLALAFAGLLLVFASRSATLGPQFWVGDLMEVTAAIFWAATTLYIKRSMANREISYVQTLFAQLLFSIPVLGLASLLLEHGQPVSLSGLILGAFAYQCLMVAFFSYLLWFWMIQSFSVSRLAAFTFLVPLFGVIFSGLVLDEPLPPPLWGGLVLVAAGIYLVNRPENGSGSSSCTVDKAAT